MADKPRTSTDVKGAPAPGAHPVLPSVAGVAGVAGGTGGAPALTPAPPKRTPGHRGVDVRDTVAEMAARAQEISLEAGSKMAAAMKDVVSAAAGISAFAVESARDLVQFMVRRGQMTQDEADKLMREAELVNAKRPPHPVPPPSRTKAAADAKIAAANALAKSAASAPAAPAAASSSAKPAAAAGAAKATTTARAPKAKAKAKAKRAPRSKPAAKPKRSAGKSARGKTKHKAGAKRR